MPEAGQSEEPFVGRPEVSQDEEPLVGQNDKLGAEQAKPAARPRTARAQYKPCVIILGKPLGTDNETGHSLNRKGQPAGRDTFTLASWAISGLDVPMTRPCQRLERTPGATSLLRMSRTSTITFKGSQLTFVYFLSPRMLRVLETLLNALAVKEVSKQKRSRPGWEKDESNDDIPMPKLLEMMRDMLKRSSVSPYSSHSQAKVARIGGSSNVTQSNLSPPPSSLPLANQPVVLDLQLKTTPPPPQGSLGKAIKKHGQATYLSKGEKTKEVTQNYLESIKPTLEAPSIPDDTIAQS
uniref:Uncharacterized protein n=1 Tax=Cannabis sativa TaxID=3483 RepID=A0A803NJS1_CANSA